MSAAGRREKKKAGSCARTETRDPVQSPTWRPRAPNLAQASDDLSIRPPNIYNHSSLRCDGGHPLAPASGESSCRFSSMCVQVAGSNSKSWFAVRKSRAVPNVRARAWNNSCRRSPWRPATPALMPATSLLDPTPAAVNAAWAAAPVDSTTSRPQFPFKRCPNRHSRFRGQAGHVVRQAFQTCAAGARHDAGATGIADIAEIDGSHQQITAISASTAIRRSSASLSAIPPAR